MRRAMLLLLLLSAGGCGKAPDGAGRASASVFGGARADRNASGDGLALARAWRYATGARVQSSPVVGDDGTVYVGSGDGALYAVAADGALRWRRGTGSYVDSSAALGASSGEASTGARDGRVRWRYDAGAPIVAS